MSTWVSTRASPHALNLSLRVALVAALAISRTGGAASATKSAATTVYDMASPSIVVVDVLDALGQPTALGSGVVVQPGQVVTNCHVVAGGLRYRVRHSRSEFPAHLEKADTDHDLCLLSVPALMAPPAQRGES